MITIVDYGVGNIQALLNMLDHIGVTAQVEHDRAAIANADILILPGVGAFDKAMSALAERSLIASLEHAVRERGVPVLGVCLGMQLLGRRSEEGQTAGLGWIEADVRRISADAAPGLKVPHIGWSDVSASRPSLLFPAGSEDERYYFVHSYHMVCDDPGDVLATVQYGGPLCCAVNRGNVWGVQFHPEKSHRFGMRLLGAFANQVPHS